jgi:hypothetical protein
MYRPSIGSTACIVVREPGNRPNRRGLWAVRPTIIMKSWTAWRRYDGFALRAGDASDKRRCISARLQLKPILSLNATKIKEEQ